MENAAILNEKKNDITKLTIENWELIPDDRNVHEIIEGEHYITSPPLIIHQKISRNIEFIFTLFFRKKPVGEILYSPVGVVFSEINVVEPDLLYISKENSHIIKKDYIRGVPNLIIEILSPNNRQHDLIMKKHLYEKFGVKEYWIIDPDDESVMIYKSRKGKYDRGKRYIEDDIITTPLIKGLEVPLKEIFKH